MPPEEAEEVKGLVERHMNHADGGFLNLVPLKAEIKIAPVFMDAYC